MKRNVALAKNIAQVEMPIGYRDAVIIPKPDAVNLQGNPAYKMDDEMRLIAMLNTLKLEDQFYKKDSQQVKELDTLIAKLAKKDPYFVAQCIVYSRCVGEGMRTINQLAAILLAKYIAGTEWAERFYSLWNKRKQQGGTIFRADDMTAIAEAFKAYSNKNITNAMKRGFANALRGMDAYTLLKYKNKLVDIINLVHPNPKGAATIPYEGKNVSVFKAIVKGYPIAADTWEVNQAEAGQMVAEAVREDLIDKNKAKELLVEAKAENWLGLLKDNKLPILAALRNIRNIMLNKPSQEAVALLCTLLTNEKLILQGKIMPHQIDLAREVVVTEFGASQEGRKIADALLKGFEASIPNLSTLLPGRTLIMLDISLSMQKHKVALGKNIVSPSSPLDKGALLAATIAKATNADVIRFGSTALWFNYDPNTNVFGLANQMKGNLGATSIAAAWQLAKIRQYDRVFIFSDYEANRGNTYQAYKEYTLKCGSPYVYSCDLQVYGTTQLKGDKVKYLYGYGFGLFDDIVNTEFNPLEAIETVKRIVI